MGYLTRAGWLKKAHVEQPDLSFTPSWVSPLPYGVGTLDLKDLKFPKQSTTKFLMKSDNNFFLDTYPKILT
jgi:hypothetical protein